MTNNHKRFSRTSFDHVGFYNGAGALFPSRTSSERYYLEAIELTVNQNDFYIIAGNSTIDLYAHVYKDHFSSLNPSGNLIAWDGKCCHKDQFKFTLELLANTKYILVVTTYNPNVTGPFSIIVYGSNNAHLQHIGE